MIRYRNRGITFAEVWFDEPVEEPLPDVLLYCQSKKRPPASVTPRLSLVNDLSASEEALWAAVGKSARYQINRARNRDGVTCVVETRPECKAVDEFVRFFDAFARQRGLSPILRPWFDAIAEENRLWLTRSVRESQAIVWHSYLVTGGTIRMLHSASHLSQASDEMRRIIARANRLLLWSDMIAAKSSGLARYDWGGISVDESSPEKKGINDFKREFGGIVESSFDGAKPISVRGRIYWKLRSAAVESPLVRRLRERHSRHNSANLQADEAVPPGDGPAG
jgi:hypothetical protein